MPSKSKKKTIDKLKKSKMFRFIETLDNGVFKSLKDSESMCNLLLIKIKNKYGDHYFIKRPDNSITVPTLELLDTLKKVLLTSENKLCSYTVRKDYINDEFESNNISFVLYSESINKRTKKAKYIICGLLFLKEYNKNILYLSLVCTKKGFGSKFLVLAETLCKSLGYNRLKFTSIDNPLGFYVSKGYKFEKGTQTYEVPDGVVIKGVTTDRDKKNIFTTFNELVKNAGYLNSKGRIRTLKDNTRTLSKKVKDSGLSRSQLQALNKKIDILFNIKKDSDGVAMYKNM